MEKKKENTIKISLNINTNTKNENYINAYPVGNGYSKIKANSKEVSEALSLIEDIRGGAFHYKDLQEIYFMNDTDLIKIINEIKNVEEKVKNNVGIKNINNSVNMNDHSGIHTNSNNNENVNMINGISSGINKNNSFNYSDDYSQNCKYKNGKGGNVFMLENDVDKACIIRFPLTVANEIKKYLLKKNLELEIEPTSLLNSRFFLIHFKNINKKFYGVLLELSTHIEIHKTLDRTNLYKTNDVSQIIYVYDKDEKHSSNRCSGSNVCRGDNCLTNSKLLERFINNNFQLDCGINSKIDKFHFENHAKLYKYHDIYFAEKLISDYLNANYYDYYDLYVKTYNEMNNHVRIERESNFKQTEIVDEDTNLSDILNSLDNTCNIMNQIEKEKGDITFETLLNYQIDNENYESDVSDLLLGGTYYMRKKK
ncbi:transcription initiation factor TFIID subunit 7 [Plasmodium brasilianum]|uniref:Transcription initiation factor TFIID subunit 7, putative n=2 Tax=Plasmodium (Plasmodium) TaxID=418103 RepID=A0A1A8X3K7_PLAMA|nr:transcription initiation factor TFIID subunit 7, putative [Plasmodium malariae]KAI4839521.1 transcription initiation factor TFIID subunit 7 [Plasmodium brasilianum]SBS99811.1 transcription initiation factor TFIID subunit 7, putative [Plasmodium malariae]SBT87943.1 transcription initiation factor TFIID subunit 7, putative [Plasmodium malariae]